MNNAYCLLVLILSLQVVSANDRNAFLLEPVVTKLYMPTTEKKERNQVTHVIVEKSARKLYLMSGATSLREYRIALGQNPIGQKEYEGDSKTPEGEYILDWRNPASRFFRSLHVSYPTPEQVQKAKSDGINPGSNIMIHGQPSSWIERIHLGFDQYDWTDGCIAVENQDILEIWSMVADGTPITIKP
jgi:murein L,D-transpeptidase YafK|tara:strand:- start:38017 stop:38577 length:561 start_codon:yes stop_codon:yes gene_type:complete